MKRWSQWLKFLKRWSLWLKLLKLLAIAELIRKKRSLWLEFPQKVIAMLWSLFLMGSKFVV
jgi:hypothetical protein